jgi:hypothetical protein
MQLLKDARLIGLALLLTQLSFIASTTAGRPLGGNIAALPR